MSNKYSSNVRTYTARNLVWDVSGGQPIPYKINAPVALTVSAAGMLPVFYRAQFPTEVDWNRESKITIKRAGIFCNFADGLVQKMDTSRVIMNITAGIYSEAGISGAITTFTKGSNAVAGTGLNVGTITPGKVIYDNSIPGSVYPYFVQAAAVASPGTAYITDYAWRTSGPIASIPMYNNSVGQSQTFTIYNIATLNSMYEAEIFFPFTPTGLATDRLFLSCQLGIDSATSLDFFTKTIDPAFNGQAVSFDSVIEVEITPL